MAPTAGNTRTIVPNWDLVRGWEFQKAVERPANHAGVYRLIVPPEGEELVLQVTGPQCSGFIHYPIYKWRRGHTSMTAPTNIILAVGGWRHSIWGFFDLPDPDILEECISTMHCFRDALDKARELDPRNFGAPSFALSHHDEAWETVRTPIIAENADV